MLNTMMATRWQRWSALGLGLAFAVLGLALLLPVLGSGPIMVAVGLAILAAGTPLLARHAWARWKRYRRRFRVRRREQLLNRYGWRTQLNRPRLGKSGRRR